MTEEKGSMLAKIIEQFLDKKTDSISISKTSTGKYSFDTKIYCEDLLDEAKASHVIKRLKEIDSNLRGVFADAEKPPKEG